MSILEQSTATPRVAIYARVSTDEQSCEAQLRELRGWCTQHGYTSVTEYVDHGVSGAKASRPELNRLMTDARAKVVDLIVTVKLDRWARSLVHLVQSMDELTRLGVRFVVTSQGIDTDRSNPMTELTINLLGSFAAFERSLIAERTCAGLRNARAKGVVLGRRARTDFDRGEVVRLRASGMSWRRIGAALGVPTMTAVAAWRTVNPHQTA
jgi:putative DNA-invertase from lambdoid prophage Rac